MDSRVSDESPGTIDSSTARRAPQSKAQVKQRKAKRRGPPQFQFLTATDPSQFKDEKVKRSVRSQAMVHYRNKKPVTETKGGPETSESGRSVKEVVVPERTRRTAVHEQHLLNFTRDSADARVRRGHLDDVQYTYPSTSAAWWHAHSRSGWVVDTQEDDMSSHDHGIDRGHSNGGTKVVKYEDSDNHADLQMRLLVGKLAKCFPVGDGVDPFSVLPQFKNPELNSVYLLRRCLRGFSTDSTMVKWLPGMLAHPHIMLSSTTLASSWIDMHSGLSGDSKRTALTKAESLSMINERLRDPDINLDDSTLVIVMHLLAGEIWNCNEKTLRIHESGIARFISQRGGLQGINEVIREISAANCYQVDIICDTAILPLFNDWELPQYTLPDDTAAVLESPLFCPRTEFTTIVQDRCCSRTTLDLLYDMRDLTDLFVTRGADLDNSLVIDVDETAHQGPTVDYYTKVTEICDRLASLPSAYIPDLPTSDDWIYEACRITALIYTASISTRVPFSVAAEPSQNPILFPSSPMSHAGMHLPMARLNEDLYEVLGRTDLMNIWHDMPGVLYWVCSVGAAASRTSATVNITQKPISRSESYAVWVRRCLAMFSTRAMIILIFQHPVPMLMAQRKLLKVQELVRTGAAGQSIS